MTPDEAVSLYKHIKANLNLLDVQGVMEIGSGDFDYSLGQPNPDFECLLDIREKILAADSKLSPEFFTVSMGMSNDFEEAVRRSDLLL